jgi:hypothetical protein
MDKKRSLVLEQVRAKRGRKNHRRRWVNIFNKKLTYVYVMEKQRMYERQKRAGIPARQREAKKHRKEEVRTRSTYK